MQPDISAVAPLDFNLATRAAAGDTLTRVTAMFADRVAIIDGEQHVTYRELDDVSTRLAHALLNSGMERQQPVALLMANSWQFMAAYYACAKAALVALPVNIALAADDIDWILRDAGADTIIVDDVALPVLQSYLAGNDGSRTVIVSGEPASGGAAGSDFRTWDGFIADGSPEPLRIPVYDRDTVQCLYTSGTTSRPKGVLTSHVSVLTAGLTNAMVIGHQWGSGPSTLVNVLPLFHTTALNTLVLPVLFTGGTVVMHAVFDPHLILGDIERHAATHLMLLPMMYRALTAAQANTNRNLDSVRTAVYAMAPMPADLLDDVDEMFPNAAVILGSGQTEVVPATVLQWPEHRDTKANSWGTAVPTVDTAILDAQGNQMAEGETGQIAYRGPHVCSGYWNNPDANGEVFEHGWFHSGDIGHLDDEHVVWFTDRVKDIIKSGGENVSSVDVERVVSAAPDVAECTVIAQSDEYWGEAVTAVIVPTADADPSGFEDRVIAFAKERLAGFQVPKHVIVVEELPKTATGKIRKHLVRSDPA